MLIRYSLTVLMHDESRNDVKFYAGCLSRGMIMKKHAEWY